MSTPGIITRDIDMNECPWLSHHIKKGTKVYRYTGPTYGCIASGIAVSFKDNETPFFEIPKDTVDWNSEKNQYPIGGYAPGNYQCKCCQCKETFFGDKRAFQCESCAIRDEKFHKYLLEVIQFIADRHIPGKTAKELFQEYIKDTYDKIIKDYFGENKNKK